MMHVTAAVDVAIHFIGSLGPVFVQNHFRKILADIHLQEKLVTAMCTTL